MAKKILVIGGSRFVGPLLIEQLLAKGHELTVFNRGQISSVCREKVRFVQGDRETDFGKLTEHFDTVVDMCAYNGEQTKLALESLDYDHFVHFSTTAVYKQSQVFPFTESSEVAGWPTMGDYSKGKIECEEVLEASGKHYATIRPDYILGPANYLDREQFIYGRISRGEEIMLPGNGQALLQFVFAKDVAAVIVMLIERQLAGAYNCVGDELVTPLGLVELMAEVVGRQPKLAYNPHADGANFNRDEFPFANENLVSSNQKVKDLGFSFTPLQAGLQADYESCYKQRVA